METCRDEAMPAFSAWPWSPWSCRSRSRAGGRWRNPRPRRRLPPRAPSASPAPAPSPAPEASAARAAPRRAPPRPRAPRLRRQRRRPPPKPRRRHSPAPCRPPIPSASRHAGGEEGGDGQGQRQLGRRLRDADRFLQGAHRADRQAGHQGVRQFDDRLHLDRRHRLHLHRRDSGRPGREESAART